LKNIFIETRRVALFREAVKVVLDTEKGQPGLMVVWGFAGMGKTEASRKLAVEKHQSVVYVRVMQDWTPRAMLAAICVELNGMKPTRVELAKRAIIEELERSPKLIFMDEADRLNISLVEHLRDIHDESGAPIAMIGEPSLYGSLTARRRIWDRVTQVVEFGPVITDDVVMFGMKACDLKVKAEAAAELVRRCQGSFRLLYHLMKDLERQAKANKMDAVELEMVEALPDRRKAPTKESR